MNVMTTFRNRLWALLPLMVVAPVQADNEDVIARCARIATPGDRILCLEDALRGPLPAEATKSRVDVTTEPVEKPQQTLTELTEPEPSEIEQFGLPEDQRKPDLPASIDVVIVAVSKNAYGKLIFTTDSGQVWQQTDSRSARYRDLPIDATIRSGVSGSYFIKPRSGGISSRIKRIR
jgi:hypothetical protein